jgi:hypothetical protein
VDILSFRGHYLNVQPDDERDSLTEEVVALNKALTFNELYDKYGNNWNNGSWKELPDGKLGEFSTYNPKSKWDWYQLGGRWSDFLKLKPGKENKGTKGDPGLFGKKSIKRGYCDQAMKKDIDFNGMRDDAGRDAKKYYKEIQEIFGGTIPKVEHTWNEVLNVLMAGKPIDERREFYNNQPAMLEVKKHQEKLGYWFELEKYNKTIEEYVQEARNKALDVHAVLVNGEWHESGEMGWYITKILIGIMSTKHYSIQFLKTH